MKKLKFYKRLAEKSVPVAENDNAWRESREAEIRVKMALCHARRMKLEADALINIYRGELALCQMAA